MKKSRWIILLALLAAIAYGVVVYLPVLHDASGGGERPEQPLVGPAFNADSAYAFCQAQCDFGPRAMNTEGHDRCGDWIVEKFRQYGCKVRFQRADLKGYDGTVLHAMNIMAQYRPELTTRVLLCAHWDSRPWADNDPDEANWHSPILAANDAASGVAVMLEIARLLNLDDTLAGDTIAKPSIGIDFVCFDAEDWGTPQWAEDQTNSGDTWALGAQYFAQHLPEGYEARFGILLDMVGGREATFAQEGMSIRYAQHIVNKVWQAARVTGCDRFFPYRQGSGVTDDHIPLNEYARIPTVDIIPYHPDCQESSFGPTWHTMADDMTNIDRSTLKAVGQTLVQVLWSEE